MDSNLSFIHFNASDLNLVDFLSAHDITAKIVSSESDLEFPDFYSSRRKGRDAHL